MTSKSTLKRKLIIPKVVLLASLTPTLVPAVTLRTQLTDQPSAASLRLIPMMAEEHALQLACLLTCGSSCSHTDNC